MASTEERMQVLKMIEEGKITAQEGAELIRLLTLEEPNQPKAPLKGASKPRWFRVRVTDVNSGRRKVDINIPIGFVETGMRMGARFIPELEDSQYVDLMETVKSGRQGKVIDVYDDEGGEHVEVFVE